MALPVGLQAAHAGLLNEIQHRLPIPAPDNINVPWYNRETERNRKSYTLTLYGVGTPMLVFGAITAAAEAKVVSMPPDMFCAMRRK